MTDSDRKIWFSAKKYGWGWGFPISWQGWLVLLGYCGLIVAGVRYLPDRYGTAAFALYITLVTILLAAICWLKGEKPRWRWGG